MDVDLSKLTPREMELANALHAGKSRIAIASAMGITDNSLRMYLRTIYLRLGITKIQELVLAVERAKAVAK